MIKVLNNGIIVERLMTKERTRGGIYVPGSGTKTDTAKVLSLGAGIDFDKIGGEIKVGDVVMLSQHSGETVSDGENTFEFVAVEDIRGIVYEDENEETVE